VATINTQECVSAIYSYPKCLICIRHAQSEDNVLLSQPGKKLGDPNFKDDVALVDAQKCSEEGLQQIQEKLSPQMRSDDYKKLLAEVELIVGITVDTCVTNIRVRTLARLERT